MIYAGTPPPAPQPTPLCIKYAASREEVDETGENRMAEEEERPPFCSTRRNPSSLFFNASHLYNLILRNSEKRPNTSRKHTQHCGTMNLLVYTNNKRKMMEWSRNTFFIQIQHQGIKGPHHIFCSNSIHDNPLRTSVLNQNNTAELCLVCLKHKCFTSYSPVSIGACMFKMEFCFFFKYFDISMQAAAAACLLLNRNRVFFCFFANQIKQK